MKINIDPTIVAFYPFANTIQSVFLNTDNTPMAKNTTTAKDVDQYIAAIEDAAMRKAMETGCGSHKQVAQTASAAGVKALVLTHITPQFSPPDPTGYTRAMWSCPKCGEKIEDNFEICWNCGTASDGAGSQTPRSQSR